MPDCHRLRWTLLGMALLLAFAGGCGQDTSARPDPPGSPATGSPPAPAFQIASLLERFRTADYYEDRCVLHLRYVAAEGPRHDQTRLAIAHRRPGLTRSGPTVPASLRIDITRDDSRLHLLGDGSRARAWVDDPSSQNMGQEVVQRPAPTAWNIAELYSLTETLDPRRPQQMISLLLGLPVHLQATHLGLLLNDPWWQALLADPRRLERLDDAPLPDTSNAAESPSACARLRIQTPDGPLTFWYDATSQTPRRLDLPTGNLFAELPADQRPRDVQLFIEWDDARWEEPSATPDRFAFVARPGDVDVRYFVLPPVVSTPAADRSTLGDPRSGEGATNAERPDARGLKFVDADGQLVGPGDWPEPFVILAWVQDEEASHDVLPTLQRAADAARVAGTSARFVLVCPDDETVVSEPQWQAMLGLLEIKLPTLRDPRASGRDILAIEESPTVVVLDPARHVVDRIVGADPQLAERLNHALRSTANTIEATDDAETGADDAQRAFAHHLQIARGIERAAPQPAALPPARDFQRLRASTAWSKTELAAPGNLLVWSEIDPQASDDQRKEFLGILQEQREVLVLDAQGQVVTKHPLQLTDTQRPTQWERWVNAKGTAWYAFHAKFGEQVYLFDGDFRPLFSYPTQPLGSATVLDVELADLDQDDAPELYVGFSEPAGVHAVDLQGRRLWQQPAIGGAAVIVAPRPMASTNEQAANSLLVVQGESGAIVGLGRGGEMGEADSIGPPPRVLHGLVVHATSVPGPATWLGLSYTLEGRPIAVGLDAGRQESWAYGLPAGVFRFQVHPPQATAWPVAASGDGSHHAWWIAAPDGSVHMIQDDGRLFDHWRTGKNLAGFAVAPRPHGLRLYVAWETEVVALDIEPPSQPTPANSP